MRPERHGEAKVVATDEGWVAWLETPAGVAASTLPRTSRGEALAALGLSRAADADPATDPLAARLAAFFAADSQGHERYDLSDVALDLSGETAFQSAVRRAVRGIAPGGTLSYGEVAAQAGSPRAARAVGQVMATNPVPPFVPCHRVLAGGGGLGGFGGGLELKRRLLEREKASCAGS